MMTSFQARGWSKHSRDSCRNRLITHYWLRRRWVVGRDEATWLGGLPWWPDWQLRLFRNIPSIVRVPGRLHSSYEIQGEARFVYDGSIYHYDLVYHPLVQRQQKVKRYDRLSQSNRVAQLYLVADDLPRDDPPDPILPIPSGDPPFQPSTQQHDGFDAQRASERRAESASLEDVRRARLWRSDLNAYQNDPQNFRAGLRAVNCPVTMTVGEIYFVDVWVRNESPLIWPSPGTGISDMIVTYHWHHRSGEPYDFPELRTRVPHTLRSGESTHIPVLVQAPVVPGCYLLQWDLLIEQVAGFSTRGWQSPYSSVHVLDDASSTLQRVASDLYAKSIMDERSADSSQPDD